MIIECESCYSMTQIREGEEPTRVCDHCAQEIVHKLIAAVEQSAAEEKR